MAQYSRADLIALTRIYADKYGIDPDLFENQIRQESGFNPNAKSPAGAEGIAQIVPKWHPGVDTSDPIASLDYAAGMMANGIHKYGSVERALSAYNSGRPDAYMDPHFARGETYRYVRNILGHAPESAQADAAPVATPPDQTPEQYVSAPDTSFQNYLNDAPSNDLMARQNQISNSIMDMASHPAPVLPAIAPPDAQAIQQQSRQFVQSAAPVGLPQAPQSTNLLGDLISHAGNAAAGYTQDQAVRNSGHGIGATAGDLLGGLVPVGAGALAGSLIPGIGTVIGGVGGAGAGGALQELQAERLAHQSPDLFRAGGMGLIQAGLQAMPVLKAESMLAAIGKNALLHGAGGAAASVGAQALNQGTLTPNIDLNQVEQMAGLAGAGGALAGKLHSGPEVSKADITHLENHPEYAGPKHGMVGTKAPGPWVNEPISASVNPADMTANPADLTQAFQDRQRPDNPGQILIPNRTQGGELLNSQGELLNGPKEADLIKGSALPEGRDLTPELQPGDIIPASKSARDSADVFKSQARDVKTAEGLVKETGKARVQAEKDLKTSTGVADPAEAQRTLGQRILELQQRTEAGEALHPDEAAQMTQDMELLDRVLHTREQERLAAEMLDQERQPAARSDLPASQPESTLPTLQNPETNDLLRSTRDIAMERAEKLGNGSDMLARPDQSNDLLQFKPKDRSGDLITEPSAVNREPGKVLEFPGKPSEPAQILGPNGKPLIKSDSPQTTPAGDTFPPAGAGESMNPARPRTQDLQQAATSGGYSLLNYAQIKRLMQERFSEHLGHFQDIYEAGKNNQTVQGDHVPIEEGGRVTNSREFSPVDFAQKTITPATEMKNLRKQYGSDYAAIRDALVQRLNKEGVKVSAPDQNIDGIGDKGIVAKLNRLAEKLPPEARTYPYVVDHNMGETVRGSSYGFRRLDRFTDTSLTGKAQNLPDGEIYRNKIPAAYQTLRDMMSRPDAPAGLKRVFKQFDSGTISKRSLSDLAQGYKEFAALKPEEWAQFCKGLGL